MKVEMNKNELAGALVALGKLVCRTSPMQVFKCLRIEAKAGEIRFSTCSLTEQITYKQPIPDGTEEFCGIVSFDEFRDAVRGCRNKMLALESGNGTLTVGERTLCLQTGLEWLTPQIGTQCGRGIMPQGFVEILSTFAPIVNRHEPRAILRGINFSHEGITATNGKELLTLPMYIDVADLTIPLPLALMQSKTSEPGRLDVWEDKSGKTFRIETEHWVWTAKALSGIYPNWQNVVPNEKNLKRSITLTPEDAERLLAFLKKVPDQPPNNETKICQKDGKLCVESNSCGLELSATFIGDWTDSPLWLNRHMLQHLLSQGHNKISTGTGHYPISATGGIGQYIAMPLYPQKTHEQLEGKTETEPIHNEVKEKEMNTETTTINTPATPETAVNPLDELCANIEAFRNKLRLALDESAILARKVKEAQISQKQKERDFIQAKRAIERIRMAI